MEITATTMANDRGTSGFQMKKLPHSNNNAKTAMMKPPKKCD